MASQLDMEDELLPTNYLNIEREGYQATEQQPNKCLLQAGSSRREEPLIKYLEYREA